MDREGDLLTTEAARRRVRMEIERQGDDAAAASLAAVSVVASAGLTRPGVMHDSQRPGLN